MAPTAPARQSTRGEKLKRLHERNCCIVFVFLAVCFLGVYPSEDSRLATLERFFLTFVKARYGKHLAPLVTPMISQLIQLTILIFSSLIQLINTLWNWPTFEHCLAAISSTEGLTKGILKSLGSTDQGKTAWLQEQVKMIYNIVSTEYVLLGRLWCCSYGLLWVSSSRFRRLVGWTMTIGHVALVLIYAFLYMCPSESKPPDL